jgi:hypothetical protein
VRWKSIAAAAIIMLAGQASADPAGWAALNKFAGTYPANGLMKSALVREEISGLLTQNQIGLLQGMSVSPPVSMVGRDLLAQFCMPHDCGSRSAVLVIDPVGQKIWVGFYDDSGKKFQMDWLGTEDPANIPPDIQRQLAKIHDPF